MGQTYIHLELKKEEAFSHQLGGKALKNLIKKGFHLVGLTNFISHEGLCLRKFKSKTSMSYSL